MTLAPYLDQPMFELEPERKASMLLGDLSALTGHHLAHCPPYRRLVERLFPDHARAASLADLPFLPVSLFKSHELASVPADKVHMVLTSSGTTGQRVSRILVDAETADLQSRALAAVMAAVLGPKRMPMLILDIRSLFKDPRQMSARGAGVLGMMRFGRAHCWALDEAMRLDEAAVREFLSKHGHEPFLMFGFTFMVWQHFLLELERLGEKIDLGGAILFHSGGWKKLEALAVDNAEFKLRLRSACGALRIHNFYGMVEQVGSVFVECEHGHLHAPAFADVIVRDPISWQPLPAGVQGVIQVLSALPHSYPGHSLLTEDLGTLQGEDDCPCGRLGRYFHVHGRMARAEVRGCSDTQPTPAT